MQAKNNFSISKLKVSYCNVERLKSSKLNRVIIWQKLVVDNSDLKGSIKRLIKIIELILE